MVSNILADLLTEVKNLNIDFPCYIRKIDNRNHWNGLQGDTNERIQKAREKLFNEEDNIYSLWYLETREHFLGVVASLTTYANPKKRNIDFLCMKKEDLNKADIEFSQVPEGRCIYVKKLHFDAQINKERAEILCKILINKTIIAERCKKKLTEKILEYQKGLKCLAIDPEQKVNSCLKNSCLKNSCH